MKRFITFALAVFTGFVSVNAQVGKYSNIPVTPGVDTECATCIRSGSNFCLWLTGQGAETVNSWNCTNPANLTYYTGGGSTPGSYYCSSGMDQVNAIMAACRPWKNQNLDDQCGSYLVDLSGSNTFPIGRTVKEMRYNSSCSYRVYSTCGYPEVQFRVGNETLRDNFDVAFAYDEGMGLDKDLDGFSQFRNYTPPYFGSYASKSTVEYYTLGKTADSSQNAAKIPDADWNGCKSTPRSLWITITRVKREPTPTEERAARSLVGLTQYNPGKVQFPDFDLTFTSQQGSSAISMVATFAMALFSLAVFAF